MNKLLLLLPVILLACTSTPAPATPLSPDKIVYQAQGYYNVAVVLETAYDNLPACGRPTSPAVCADTAIKKKVRAIDEVAWAAISEAQAAVRTPGFGQDKIATFLTSATALTKAFSDIAETLPKK